jgi:serine/threonine-protein kinase
MSGVSKLPVAFVMPFQPDEVIAGKYRIQGLIGTGGVGFVVAATHVGLDDSVALKFLKPEFATHPEAVSRFTIEARASFKIKNEHVARVLDVDTLRDGTPFMVMELLEGRDLRSILETHRYLPVDLAVDLVLQSCEALAAAHACHIVHRDIKPENLFVTQVGDDDHIKVLDFGISKVALTQNSPVRKTRATALTMMAVGTPPYMSPEQVRASTNLDARADIWSIGCVLYELLTGHAPFERMSLMQACAAVLEEDPLPLLEGCPEAPPELEAVVMRCLTKNPAGRYQDVAELALALSPFAARSAHCAERCVELLAEGVRRSDPEYRRPDLSLRNSDVQWMRIPTRATPAAPRELTPQAFAVHRPLDATESESMPVKSSRRNRWVLLAVGALSVLSGTYVLVRHSASTQLVQAPKDAAAVHVSKSDGSIPSHVGATASSSAGTPPTGDMATTVLPSSVVEPAAVAQPETPTITQAATDPAVQAPNTAAELPQAAPAAAPAATQQATRRASSRRVGTPAKSSAKLDEPDVGY